MSNLERRRHHDIKKMRLKNAFAKHLEDKHKNGRGDTTAFSFKVVKTYKKPHERQISEGVRISNSEADLLMNGKSEWMQPAVQRIQMTREVPLDINFKENLQISLELSLNCF